MLTQENVIAEVSAALSTAAKRVVARVMEQYGTDVFGNEREIDGMETSITPSLSSEITSHLLDEVKKALDGRVIDGIRFDVNVYKQIEENIVGADLLGVLSMDLGERTITKYYLAQAKIGKRRASGKIYAANPDILKQAREMLKLTADSFFFLYTRTGVDVVSAFPVDLMNQNVINTKYIKEKSFSDFYQDFFNCFIGDNRYRLLPFLIKPLRTLYPTDLDILYIHVDLNERRQ